MGQDVAGSESTLTREVNRRVSEAFQKEDISLGVPQSVVLKREASPPSAPQIP